MSMISSLIDELNKSADEWNNSNMFELARMCREAADTIWQLRDDLQRTNAKFNAENAKLREERDMYRDLVGMMDHPDLNAQLQAENAKLRELAAGIGYLLFALDVDYCVACPRDVINHPCPVYTVERGECLYKTDLRELGVEVE